MEALSAPLSVDLVQRLVRLEHSVAELSGMAMHNKGGSMLEPVVVLIYVSSSIKHVITNLFIVLFCVCCCCCRSCKCSPTDRSGAFFPSSGLLSGRNKKVPTQQAIPLFLHLHSWTGTYEVLKDILWGREGVVRKSYYSIFKTEILKNRQLTYVFLSFRHLCSKIRSKS